MSYENEYEVCQVRGHEASGVSTTIGMVTWQICRWCNTEFHEGPPQIIEREDEPAWSLTEGAFSVSYTHGRDPSPNETQAVIDAAIEVASEPGPNPEARDD